jgi:uncharacterized protein (TIGR02594 family)
MTRRQFAALMASLIVAIGLYGCIFGGYIDDPTWLTQINNREGLAELPGPENNPWIIEAFKLCGLPSELQDDNKTSWCSAGLNKIMDEVGLRGTGDARAESWCEWGGMLWIAKKGAICVFCDAGNYHVTVLNDTETVTIRGEKYYSCIGCNQSDRIKISLYKVKSLMCMRWATADLVL